MERYENIIKIEDMRRLVEDEQYVKAYKVLQTLDTNKIKSLTDLSIISDVYAQNEEYDKAKQILLRIYAKNKTRRILYQLVDLSIKEGDVEESEEYLYQYRKIAPNDSYQFIFRYCIDKLKEEPYDILIESLEKLKEYDYFEVWAYELAKLYHKAGMKDKCIRECTDIMLWFGSGMYVEKARLLKAFYVGDGTPLQFVPAKEKKNTEDRLGLDKTKDYSNIRNEIDRHLKAQEKEEEQKRIHNRRKEMEEAKKEDIEFVQPFLADDDSHMNYMDMTVGQDDIEAVQMETEEENVEEVVLSDSEEEMEVEEIEAVQAETEEENVEEVILSDSEEEMEVEEIQAVQAETEENSAFDDLMSMGFFDDTLGQVVELEDNILDEEELEATPLQIMNELIEQYRNEKKTVFHEVFKYFYEQEEVKSQLEAIFDEVLSKKSSSKNFVVVGREKSGKTTLGKMIAKMLYEYKIITASKVAKISAVKLNSLVLKDRIESLLDGTLIIEEANKLSDSMLSQIMECIGIYDKRFIVILEMCEDGYKEWKERSHRTFILTYFNNTVYLPSYTRVDKLGFILKYIDGEDYQLSPQGKLIILKALEEMEEHLEEEKHIEALFELVKKALEAANIRNKNLLRNIVQYGNFEVNDLLFIEEEDFYQVL